MAIVDIVDIPATVVAGLYAGIVCGNVVIRFARSALPSLMVAPIVRMENALFGRIVFFLGIAAIALLILTTAVARGPARWFYAAATLAALTNFALALIRSAPIDRKIASWDDLASTDGWPALHGAMLRTHLVHAVLAVTSLIFACAGLAWA